LIIGKKPNHEKISDYLKYSYRGMYVHFGCMWYHIRYANLPKIKADVVFFANLLELMSCGCELI